MSEDYQPPPIATVRGVLTLPETATAPVDGVVRVLLVWQRAGWTPDPGDAPWQGKPVGGRRTTLELEAPEKPSQTGSPAPFHTAVAWEVAQAVR